MVALGSIADIAKVTSKNLSTAMRQIDTSSLTTFVKNMDNVNVSTVMKRIDGDVVTRIVRNLSDVEFDALVKKLDDVALAKLAKNFDDFPDAAKATMRNASGAAASAIDDAATLGKRMTRGVTKFCSKNPILCASPVVYGGLKYIQQRKEDEANRERENKVRECISVCLPMNWDEFKDGTASEIEYKSKSDDFEFLLTPDSGDTIDWEDQPLCERPTDQEGATTRTAAKEQTHCETFCTSECEKVIPPVEKPNCSITNPGACLPDNPFDPTQWLDQLRDMLNRIFGGLFNVDYLIYACSAICCLMLAVMFFG